MLHLFSPEGDQALIQVLQRQPLLALDFDGTLTPIVARPGDVRLAADVSERLARLTAHLPIAVVTGRSVEDVRGRLGFEPRFIVGNHGSEDVDGGCSAEASSAALSRIRVRLNENLAALDSAGVTIEDKGHTLALHYRMSSTRHRALRVIAGVLAHRDEGVRVFGGKFVINIVPKQAPDKADAVRSLLARSGANCAIFAGDDVNDEPVFASAPEEWLTIRVGRDGRRSKARYYLDSPAEMALVLERLVVLLATP